MDDFKVACIFTKVECVEYVYSSVTIGLEL
jgi:hypothetical protein